MTTPKIEAALIDDLIATFAASLLEAAHGREGEFAAVPGSGPSDVAPGRPGLERGADRLALASAIE